MGVPERAGIRLARHCSAHRCFHDFHDGGLREISLSCCGYMRASACLGNSKSRQKTGRSSCRSEKSKILLTPSPRVSTIFGNSFQSIADSRRVTGQGLRHRIADDSGWARHLEFRLPTVDAEEGRHVTGIPPISEIPVKWTKSCEIRTAPKPS